MRKILFFTLALIFTAASAWAQNDYLAETFDEAIQLSDDNEDGKWYVDRYTPKAFVKYDFNGTNVLRIHIHPDQGSSNRGGQSSTFYNTQGRKFNQEGLNATIFKGDLYIPSDWASSHRRTDMWATAFTIEGVPVPSYPIIGFRNMDGSSPTFSYWMTGTGWVDLHEPPTYNEWYSFEMKLIDEKVYYYIDGDQVGYEYAPEAVYYGNVIMQAYNFNDPNLPIEQQDESDYDAYWDNLITQSGVYNFTKQTYHPTIQAAIEAAQDGDVIEVAAGTYEEQLYINTNNLTINGAGTNNTTIVSPDVLTESFQTGTNTNKPIVFVDGVSNFTLYDLTIDGKGKGNENVRFMGIGFWNSGGTIENVDVTGIRSTPLSGEQHGVAVYAYNDDSGPYSISCSNMAIDDYQKNAMALLGEGLIVTLDEITTVGAGQTDVIAQNGIQIGFGSGGTISNSNVSGNVYTGTGWSSAGILAYIGNEVHITNTHLTNNYVGVDMNHTGGSFIGGSNINNNTDAHDDGIYFRNLSSGKEENQNEFGRNVPEASPVIESYSPGKSDANFTFDIEDVKISGNVPGSWGVYIRANQDKLTVSLNRSDISGYSPGIYSRDDGGIVQMTANNNDLSGNSPWAFYSTSASEINATCNWFGTTVADDVAAKVSANINVSTILLNNILDPNDDDYFCGAPIDLPVQNMNTLATYATIQEAIDAALPGHVIQVAPGTYEEALYIDKDLTITGAGRDVTEIIAPDDIVYRNWGSGSSPIVGIDQATVDISGFTINGMAKGGLNQKMTGVHFWAASGSLTDSKVTGIRHEPLSGAQNVVAVFVNHEWDETINHTVTIENNIIEDYQKNAIAVNEPGASAIIRNNTITGSGPIDVIAQNGIQFGYGLGVPVNGVIEGNTVSDNWYTGEGWSAAGVLLVGVDEINVIDNVLESNQHGVDLYYDGSWGSEASTLINVSENQIVNSYNGLRVGQDCSPGTVENNEFTENVRQVSAHADAIVDLDPILANNTFDCSVVVRGSEIQVPKIFSSIQDAIDAAGEGNTIEVGPGTYEERVRVETENLTITTLANDPATVLYDGNDTQANFDIHAAGVTVENFNIVRKGAVNKTTAQAVAVRAGNVTIKNNTITGENSERFPPAITVDDGYSSEFVGDVVNVTIQGNDISGDFWWGVIAYDWGGDNDQIIDGLEIINNTIDVNNSTDEPRFGGGIRLRSVTSAGTTLADGIHNVVIEGNKITGEVGVQFEIKEPTEGTITSLANNNFAGVTAYAINNDVAGEDITTDYVVPATCNWFGTDVFSEIDALVSDNVTWSPYLLTADGPCGGFAPVANVTQGTYFTSIGAAVVAAAANNVIEVGEGIYNETFTIDVENLTLRAKAGQAVTIDGENTGNVVEITANGVTLKGFTVINGKHPSGEGPGNDGSGEIKAAIKLDGADGVKLFENTIENSWYGIWLSEATNSEIIDNTIDGSATIGIALVESSTGNIVKENTIINTGIEHEGVPVVQGERGLGAGIRIEADNNTIHDNIIQDNDGDGIRIQPVVGPDNTIEDLVITDNLIHQNNQHGIRLGAGNNITITGNTITENGESEPGVRPHQRSGLYVYQSGATGDFGVHTVRNNIFAGNEPYGVNVGHDHDAHDVGDILLDVKRNYWGAESGPSTDEGFFSDYTKTSLPTDGAGNPLSSDADGDGDAVSIDVVFGPYWKNEAMTQLSPITQEVAEGDDGDFDGTTINPDQTTTLTLKFFGEKPADTPSKNRGLFGDNYYDALEGYYEIVSTETVTFTITFDVENIEDVKNPDRLWLLQREEGALEWENEYRPEDKDEIDGTKLTWSGITQTGGVDYEYGFANGDQVEIAINRLSCNEFAVVVRPTATISNTDGPFDIVNDLQFTIKWPVTDAELTFDPFDEDVNPNIVQDGGFNYATYNFTGFDDFQGKEWTGGEESVVATFHHNQGGDEDGTFSIMEDDDPFTNPMRVFSVDYMGNHLDPALLDATGVVYHPEGELSPVDVPLGKCPLTIGGTFTAENKVYDGDETATIATNDLTLVTVIGSDEVTLDAPTVEFSDKNAAVGKTVSIISASISGENAGKYELSIVGAPTALADITKRPLTANIIGNPSKVYNGNNEAINLKPENYEFETGEGVGLVGEESITINKTSGTYASADVGTHLITVDLVNDDFTPGASTLLSNYELPATATGNGTITKKGLIVKAEDKEKLFDGEIFPIEDFTVTYDGFVAEENESDLGGTLAFTGDAVTAVNIGEYTITPEGLTSDNYEIDFQDGTLKINPITIALKAFLQGSYDEREGFKNVYNTLRNAGQVPVDQPYTEAPARTQSPLDAQAVDWVLVEFRDKDNPETVVGRVAGLPRTTGNFSVVVADNTVKAGTEYYIVINHRNHLPIMSKDPQTAPILTGDRFDMSDSDNLLEGSYFKQDDIAFLTAGDATGSGELAYSGPGNDRGRVLARMIAAGATSFNDTPPLDGYFFEDIRMNNKISYVEAPNDRGIILSNIGEFTGESFLNLRWSSPVPGYGPAKTEYFNDGPVHILAEANAISIRSDEAINNGLIDNIQFTLAWHTGDDIAEQAISNMKSTPFMLKPQGEAVDINGTSYLVMVSINPTLLPAYWAADEAIELITFTNDISKRLWIADNAYTMENNAMYYVSIWGDDFTGEIKTGDDDNDITGIDEDASESSFRLYPNPVNSGQLFVDMPGAQGSQVDIAIYDIRGSVVARIADTNVSGTLSINVSGLAGGIYYLRATAGSQVFNDKFVVSE